MGRLAVWGGVLVLAGLWVPPSADAHILCAWFGRCLYESPGFRVTVVDHATGQPLEGVHALAEWVIRGRHGRNGPLMVQDAVSGPDGILTFPPWRPVRGPREGLVLNLDPAISLFKPGYRTRLVQNAYPPGTTETTRVRRFGQDGTTIAMEPFSGSAEGWVEELRRAAYPETIGVASDAQLLTFKVPFLNRRRAVGAELQTIAGSSREAANLARAFADSLRRLEQLGQ